MSEHGVEKLLEPRSIAFGLLEAFAVADGHAIENERGILGIDTVFVAPTRNVRFHYALPMN